MNAKKLTQIIELSKEIQLNKPFTEASAISKKIDELLNESINEANTEWHSITMGMVRKDPVMSKRKDALGAYLDQLYMFRGATDPVTYDPIAHIYTALKIFEESL